MDKITKALRLKVEDNEAFPAVTPIYQASAFQANSPFFYTRKKNPNVVEIEEVIATIEEAKFCIGTSTGMSAISLALQLLQSPGTIILNKDVYGCSFKALQKFSDKYKFDLLITDLALEENLESIPDNVQMVIFETPTNPFLKNIDIQKVSKAIKGKNPEALVVVDNTWATPLFQQPLKWGADISIHSATKYISGHSDVMAGFALTDSEKIYQELQDQRFYYGAILEPFSAWLLRRSMQTFEIRMLAHQDTCLKMKSFLETLPQVKKVYYPKVDGQQLTGYGALLFFELRDDLSDQYIPFRDSLQLFNTGTGMACVTSMVAQPSSGSHASLTECEKTEMGIHPGVVRLSFGLEKYNDLKDDLLQAFKKIELKKAYIS
jgi:cystathionine beta-lyase/cystathionine gamma-synthase